ncbi:MAG: hypothetical protein ACHQVS_04950, partial [Candidatus Babeliales bacterium]
VRMVCTACREFKALTQEEKQRVISWGAPDIDERAYAKGCVACLHTGYKGRIGIFEYMSITPQLRTHIVRHPSYDILHDQAQHDGMKPLLYDGLSKVRDGITTVEELLRVAS